MQFRASWNVSGEPLYKALPNSLALVFWAFTGLESASVAAAVVENPERNVPIATIAGVLIAALIYIAASIVIFGLAPAADIAASNAPFALAAAKMMGPVAGPLVALCGGLKALGTLAGWVLMTAQVSRAAADHGLLPQMFARTRAGDTPVAGLIIAGLVRHGPHRAHHRAHAGQAVRLPGRGLDAVRAAHVPGRLRGGGALSGAR